MKKLVFAVLPVLFSMNLHAQTLFTYGKKAVSKNEFLTAFNKNPNVSADRKQALKEYLDLYINYKLKVQAAYDMQLHKDANQQAELENFKKQVAENYLDEEAGFSQLVSEAFERSQKDIRVAQVFIEVLPNNDTAAAFKNITAAYTALRNGETFEKVTQQFSSDEATRQTSGDIGFVTVFTLPYSIESIVYTLPLNGYSAPYRSKAGYHIFKKTEERNARGTRQVAQILIALPPQANAAQKEAAKDRADSVYGLLQNGAPFTEMVNAHSNDMHNASSGGLLTEFGTGEYSQAFEEAAFSLKEPGQISRPFLTEYGYHILKLIQVRPVATDESDVDYLAYLKTKVKADQRLAAARKMLTKTHLQQAKYKPSPYNANDLWAFTDSSIFNRNTNVIKGMNPNTTLFSFAKESIKAGDWVKFAKAMRNGNNQQNNYRQLMKDYVEITAEEYYKAHLEDYNVNYKNQVKEFEEANMLFSVMEKNVWSKASADTTALRSFYSKNKTRYQWAPSADAIIFTCNNEETARDLRNKLLTGVTGWRAVADSFGNKVTADSGRFELGQLPVIDRTNFTNGLATAPVKNDRDESYTFNYIVKVYNETGERSFDDAKGMVISDYQVVLENKWLAALKAKYPVVVNKAVFASIK